MKKQNQEVFSWSKALRRHSIWLAAVVFVLAAGVCWWYAGQALAAGSFLLGYFFDGSDTKALTVNETAASDPGTIAPRRLDGVLVDADEDSYIPYGVMIENLREVRPQSGLSAASVVYETLAEGGSTRFLAVFDPSATISEIMPVRSARAYYLEWISEFGGLYAHAGGSPKALTIIRENADIHNLDALTSDGKYFWRDRSRSAPHNLVTSSEKMLFALRDKGLEGVAATFTPWRFKDDALLADRGADARTVSFNFSGGLTYRVDFTYKRNGNVYLRANAGQPHLDKNTGQQITAKNVIVQLVREPGYDNTGKGRLDIYVGGTGNAWIFRDGQAVAGTWKKDSRTARTTYYDQSGAEIRLNRGATWVHVLPETQAVTYQ